MYPTQIAAFILENRIDLKDFIEEHYGIQFTQHNSEWVCGSLSIISNNRWREGAESGNIVNWVARRENCSESQAVGIINSRIKPPYTFKTQHYHELERIFHLISKRYRFELIFNNRIRNELQEKGVDIDFASQRFGLGALKSDQELRDSLLNQYSNPDPFISRLYLVRNSKKHFLSGNEAWSIPIVDKNEDIQGFHGIDVKGKPYYTGWLYSNRGRVLLGEANAEIAAAIRKKGRVIVTEEAIDFLLWQQKKYVEVLSSLTGIIAPQRFDELQSMKVDQYLFGFTQDKGRKKLVGLAFQHLKSNPLKFTQKDPFKNHAGPDLQRILKNAIAAKVEEEEALWEAAIERNREQMDLVKSVGGICRISRSEAVDLIRITKGSHKKLQTFLKGKRKSPNNIENRAHITISLSFTGDELKSELRTLLYLLTKKSGEMPIRLNRETIGSDLGINQKSVGNHLKRLEDARYIIRKKEYYGKKVVHLIEASTIRFYMKGSIK
jgi:DNA-binding transcriptional ArsR family regulator